MTTKGSSWSVVSLSDVADSRLGKMLSAASRTGRNSFPYLRNLNVRWDGFDLDDVLEMDFQADEVEKYQLQDGDVLVCEGGEPGRAAVWENQLPGALFQKALHRVRPNKDLLDSRFLMYHLLFDAKTGRLSKYFTGSGIKHFTGVALKRYQIVLPPSEQQEQIVSKLDEGFTKVAAAARFLYRAQQGASRYRQAVLQAAVTGSLSDGNENDGELITFTGQRPDIRVEPSLPADWQWVSLDQVAAPGKGSITDGPFGSNLKTVHYTESGPRVIRLANVGNGVFKDMYSHISADRYERLVKHSVRTGDVVVAALGHDLPRACVIPPGVEPAIVKADCIRVRPSEFVSARYLSLALNSPLTKAQAVVHGVGRPRLNLAKIKALPIPLPPREEQERLAEEVERCFSGVQMLENEIAMALTHGESMRHSMLGWAFDGRLS